MKRKIKILLLIIAVIVVYALAQDQALGGGKDPELTDSGEAEVSGISVKVNYVPKAMISPAFGRSFLNEIEVRTDLSPRVKRFVRSHELYHVGDRSYWGGWLGREIRANLVPGLKDPIGLLAAIAASLPPERLSFYIQRFKQGR
ncbi:MAG: hypothetical protein M1275_02675 [Patescibacteria group bacterium]|nr:hypothetical protein [Patescibacteria group bacterium]